MPIADIAATVHSCCSASLRFGDTFANEGMLALLRDTNLPMFAQVTHYRVDDTNIAAVFHFVVVIFTCT